MNRVVQALKMVGYVTSFSFIVYLAPWLSDFAHLLIVLGLSFPAFVELCSTIAHKCFPLPLGPDGWDNSSCQETIPGEPIKRHRSAFIAFVEHCVMAMKDNSTDSTLGSNVANSSSFRKLQEPRRTL